MFHILNTCNHLHYMGLDRRKPACEQQMQRPACKHAQSDHHLCYSLAVAEQTGLTFTLS